MTRSSAQPCSGSWSLTRRWSAGSGRASGPGNRIGKTWVAGAVQRGGQIRLAVIPNRERDTIHAFVKAHVSDDTEALYTDELASYLGMASDEMRHETVNHSADEWVFGDVHTNSVENVWSLLKRSIIGSFHKVSFKHLDRYLDELEFRLNNRDNPYLFRDVLHRILTGEALRYEALTA